MYGYLSIYLSIYIYNYLYVDVYVEDVYFLALGSAYGIAIYKWFVTIAQIRYF